MYTPPPTTTRIVNEFYGGYSYCEELEVIGIILIFLILISFYLCLLYFFIKRTPPT